MTTQQEKHEAVKLPIGERVDYLAVVAAMLAADGVVDPAELSKLRELCLALELPSAEMGEVLAFAHAPAPERVRATLMRMTGSDLKFTLMTDCIFMAYADGKVPQEEEAEIRAISDALGISAEQVAALRKFVDAVNRSVNEKLPPERAKAAIGDAVAGVASVGVPIAAVAVSGSVFGLSAAGITSGLAALGLGFGMLSGLGVAIGIGVGSFMGVRWLYKKVVDA